MLLKLVMKDIVQKFAYHLWCFVSLTQFSNCKDGFNVGIANQLTGFYMMATLAFNEFKQIS